MERDWKHLACADKAAVEKLLQSSDVFPHKVLTDFEEEKHPLVAQMVSELCSYYTEALKFCTIEKLAIPYQIDSSLGHTSMGVFAQQALYSKQSVPGMMGLLARVPIDDVEIGKNDFSMHTTSEGNVLMLGPVSFVNSSCRPNCEYYVDLKKMTISLRVKDGLTIQPEEELLVQYSGSYFGSKRESCECPYVEYHDKPCVFKGRTRSATRSLRKHDNEAYEYLDSRLATPNTPKESASCSTTVTCETTPNEADYQNQSTTEINSWYPTYQSTPLGKKDPFDHLEEETNSFSISCRRWTNWNALSPQ